MHYLCILAKDRGCSFPNCDVARYHTEAHHVSAWATTHVTDVDNLTLACGPNHKLAEQGWTTRKRVNGDTGRPRVDSFHHPANCCVLKKTTTCPSEDQLLAPGQYTLMASSKNGRTCGPVRP